jgi:WD40 repeat protein
VADDNGEVKIFGFEDAKIKYLSSGHSTSITSVVIAPDGKTVVSGDKSGSVIIWRIRQ